MPIVQVTAIELNSEVISEMLSEISVLGASALETTPDNVWAIFHPVPAEYYFRGKSMDKYYPPIVTIKAQSGRPAELRTAFAKIVSSIIAKNYRIAPEHIWLHYQEMRPQDVWFDGHWAR